MPLLNKNAVTICRRDLLKRINAFAEDYLLDLERRKVNKESFQYYIELCSPAVLNLITWEGFGRRDVDDMPSVKQLFALMTQAAQNAVFAYGETFIGLSGKGRRTFSDISEAELAAFVLPKLEHLIEIWGIDMSE